MVKLSAINHHPAVELRRTSLMDVHGHAPGTHGESAEDKAVPPLSLCILQCVQGTVANTQYLSCHGLLDLHLVLLSAGEKGTESFEGSPELGFLDRVQ